jgi:hypothetical protein
MRSGDQRGGRLVAAAERLLRRHGRPGGPDGQAPWKADFFGLQRVREFCDAAPAEQGAALDDCAQSLLSEAWQIERGGVVFCARMVLLSETEAERRIFALIGAEEARHSAWLEPWVTDRGEDGDPFNAFVSDLARTASAPVLVYLLQVVLEGFGVGHYARLAQRCHDAALASTFVRMAQDEALHYAAGLAAFSPTRLDAAERRVLAESAYAFLQLMRSGPQRVVAALDRRLGLASGRLVEVFDELDTQRAASTKLDQLARLMRRPGMEWLVDELHAKGAFAACSPRECARLYTAAA